MANETVLFKRGDSATITSTPITDGQILFDTSGNGKMYLDNGTTRLAMGGSVTIDSTLSKTSTNAVQNKAVTGNILNSLAEVSAATQQNTIAGALALKEVNSSLKDSTSGESFNFGSLNGVRGFFTNPSKADDSFVPFKSESGNDVKVISLRGTGRASKNIDFSYLANFSVLTNDAFAVCPTGVQNYSSSPNTSLTISTSYNAKTGILTVTANEADGFRFNVDNVCVYVK